MFVEASVAMLSGSLFRLATDIRSLILFIRRYPSAKIRAISVIISLFSCLFCIKVSRLLVFIPPKCYLPENFDFGRENKKNNLKLFSGVTKKLFLETAQSARKRGLTHAYRHAIIGTKNTSRVPLSGRFLRPMHHPKARRTIVLLAGIPVCRRHSVVAETERERGDCAWTGAELSLSSRGFGSSAAKNEQAFL
jgi:hypothetical protein